MTKIATMESLQIDNLKTRLKQRRVCFLTGTRIGLPVGLFVALKIVFAVALCLQILYPEKEHYVVLNERDGDDAQDQCTSNRKQLVALLLSIFLGELGVDQFYIGNIGLGVGKLLTCGGCGVWWLVDVILFAIGDHYRDHNGCALTPI
jgi:hypothetical protein